MFRSLLLACVVTLTLSLTPLARAQRPETPHLFPEDTVAFIRLTDVEEFKTQFRNTAIGQMLRDSLVQPTVTQLWQRVKKAVEPAEQRFGTTLDELLAIPQGEIAFGIVPVPLAEPAFVLIADIGDQPDVLRGLIEQGEQAMLARGSNFDIKEIGGTEVSIFETPRDNKTDRLLLFERDDAVCICSHSHVAEQVLQNWSRDAESKPLANQGVYKSTMRCVRSSDSHEPQFYFFADVVGFARAATRGDLAANAGLAMLPTLGLDKLKAVGLSWTLIHDDFDSLLHGHILIDTPRKGVLDMVAFKPAKLAPEPWVPRDALTYTTFNWDVPRTLSALDGMLTQFQGAGAMTRWLTDTFSDPLGVDIEKEFFEELTGRFIRVEWMEPPLTITSQASLLAAELRDPERFSATWDKIVQRQSDKLRPQTIGNVVVHQIDRAFTRDNETGSDGAENNDPRNRRLGRRGRRRGMPPEATFAIVGDYFFFADRPGILKEVLETEDYGESLAKSDSFDEATNVAVGQRGGKNAGLYTFFDAEWIYRHRYAMVTAPENQAMIAERFRENEFVMSLLQVLIDTPLPPFESLRRYVAQTGASVIADEESGWHYTSFLLKRREDRRNEGQQ